MDMDKDTFIFLVLIKNVRRFVFSPLYFLCNLGGEIICGGKGRGRGKGFKKSKKVV